jgi:hypothetical protein
MRKRLALAATILTIASTLLGLGVRVARHWVGDTPDPESGAAWEAEW